MEVIKEFFERMEARDERRGQQMAELMQSFKKDFSDHDLIVRLDEKFNMYAKAEIEHRERIAKESGIQEVSISKAHKRLDEHEKENNEKFDKVLRFQYIQTGVILIVVFLLSNADSIAKIFSGITGKGG